MNRYDDDSKSTRRPADASREPGPDATLDRVVSEIRDEAIDPKIVGDAAARVWASLTGEGTTSGASAHSLSDDPTSPSTIRGCAGFQALIPSYVARSLPPARALLLEDHVRDCVPCRAALDSVRGGRPVAKVVPFG